MLCRLIFRAARKEIRVCSKCPSSSQTSVKDRKDCRLLVVGGGSGGLATASCFSSKLGKGQVIVVEPRDMHFYQPMWTLVGGGVKPLQDSVRPMKDVMPQKAQWVKDEVESFCPEENFVVTKGGMQIRYDFLVVAMGIQVRFDMIKGLEEALQTPYVGSNYSYETVTKTLSAMQNLKGGNAVFTFPTTPVKCPGAAQKIVYLTDAYLRKEKRREGCNLIFNTSLGVLFGVKKYADALWKVAERKGVQVNLRQELVEVKSKSKEAVFQLLDSKASPKETVTYKYEMLHVTPPMVAPPSLKSAESLSDAAGFLNVDANTLQHKTFPNIFGIGDCTNVPTAKTAAAVAAEYGVLRKNLANVMNGKKAEKKYDGYTSCPLVTGDNRCILAEFDYSMNPLETFPVNQAVERRTMYHLKKDIMPQLYWHFLLRGHWGGPSNIRKLLHLGLSK